MEWYAPVTLCHRFHTIVNVKLDLVVFEFTDTGAQTWIFAADLVGFPVGIMYDMTLFLALALLT